TDVDGDKLVFKMAANPKNGECRLQDDQLVYFPDIGFTGKDEIEVEVSDGYLTDKILFPITIGEHPNAIPVHLEESSASELQVAFKRLVYELNARLSRSEDFILKLESEVTTEPSEEILADENKQGLEVALSTETPSVESLTLDDWIASLKEPNKGHRFTFHAESVENNEKWLVAPFLDPASSADAEVISEGSYGDAEEEEETTGGPTDSGQSENNDNETANPVSKDSPKIEEENDNSQENEEGKETLPVEKSFSTLGELVDENRIPNAQRHEGAQGWYRIDALGDFYDAGNGWIFQPDLGWCYAVVITEDFSWWLFNENTGWVWCRPDLKNTVFATGTLGKGWIFFPGASLSETETFYSYSTQEWFLWKR
ncbi:MAG: Ig-like domain-containing protein, partial [Opitutales bacterium]